MNLENFEELNRDIPKKRGRVNRYDISIPFTKS
jgi:hypothetical protein